MIPLRTDSPLAPTPYLNWALIVVNVLAFLAQSFIPASVDGKHWTDHLLLNAAQPEIKQYFTSLFLHANVMHLIGNMVFLYVFGNNVNDKMGHLGYAAFYLSGGVAAGIAYVLATTAGGQAWGASGAVSAVTGAFLILFPRSHITVLNLFLFWGTFEIPCLWFVLFFFFQDVVLNFAGNDRVAHVAHIGGTLFGSAVSLGLLATHLLPRDQFDVVALIKQWNRRRQYRDAVSAGWDPYVGAGPGERPAHEPGPPDPKAGRVLDLRGGITDAIAAHDLPRTAELYVELKQVDPAQVLPRQAQLDIANQLTNQQLYPQAAEAYELFLRHYPKFEQIEQVELMLGIIYARYLERYERTREVLLKATARLHSQREIEMARAELAQIEPLMTARAPGG